MSTFYGGEQLDQVVKVVGTNTDLDPGERPLIYTVPTGFYGILKFAYVGQNINYPNSYWNGSAVQVALVPPLAPLNTTTNSTNAQVLLPGGGSWKDTKEDFSPVRSASESTFYNTYLEEGAKFTLVTGFSNQNVRYELHVHLYKKP